MSMPKCDSMRGESCTDTVTYIGEKGYVYCATCARIRAGTGYERTRTMTPHELALLGRGECVPSFSRPTFGSTVALLETVNESTGKRRFYVDGRRVSYGVMGEIERNSTLSALQTTIREGVIRHYAQAQARKSQ